MTCRHVRLDVFSSLHLHKSLKWKMLIDQKCACVRAHAHDWLYVCVDNLLLVFFAVQDPQERCRGRIHPTVISNPNLRLVSLWVCVCMCVWMCFSVCAYAGKGVFSKVVMLILGVTQKRTEISPWVNRVALGWKSIAAAFFSRWILNQETDFFLQVKPFRIFCEQHWL